MARRHYASKKKPVPPAAAPAAPVRSAKAQALMDAAAEQERERARHEDRGFVPKPRAVRRFEKYANMGE